MLSRNWTKVFQERPLAWLTLIATVPRLLAAIFSGGYYAHDDHFLVIEAAQSWVDGADYNLWLPWNQPAPASPTGHMMVYPGLHFLLFKLCAALGLNDPGAKMVLVRLLHAAWSLVTVRVGYRMALRLAGPAIAWRCGLFLALFFFMPFLSVRNLIEMVSVPLLMLSAWQLLQAQDSDSWKRFAWAGLFAGLALNIRFQTVFFTAGAGAALLLRGRWSQALVFGACALAPLVVLQGTIDLFIWGRPFVELLEYVGYNADNTTTYGVLPWYNYLLLLAGVFIPPFSLAVMRGFFGAWRTWAPWCGVVCFILVHSLVPNKQERFLLPVVPLFFVLGYCAWETWRLRSTWWQQRPGLWRGVMIWTWTLNTLLLVPLTFSYSKHERVEAMGILRRTTGVKGVLIEDTAEHDAPMAPRYYWGEWRTQHVQYTDTTVALSSVVGQGPAHWRANTVLFVGDEELAARVARVEQVMGPLHAVGVARPGLLDRVMHWLNPVNRNAVITIYGTGEVGGGKGPHAGPGS